MKLFQDLQTEQGRAKFKSAMDAETARIVAEISADRKANGGLSKTERSPRTDWQYQNSNFGMGI